MPDGGVHRTQNAQFRMTLLPGFKLEWLALIIVAVFAGFARGQLLQFREMGFGVAVALILDATLIRLVILAEHLEHARSTQLVPAPLAGLAAAPPGGTTPGSTLLRGSRNRRPTPMTEGASHGRRRVHACGGGRYPP